MEEEGANRQQPSLDVAADCANGANRGDSSEEVGATGGTNANTNGKKAKPGDEEPKGNSSSTSSGGVGGNKAQTLLNELTSLRLKLERVMDHDFKTQERARARREHFLSGLSKTHQDHLDDASRMKDEALRLCERWRQHRASDPTDLQSIDKSLLADDDDLDRDGVKSDSNLQRMEPIVEQEMELSELQNEKESFVEELKEASNIMQDVQSKYEKEEQWLRARMEQLKKEAEEIEHFKSRLEHGRQLWEHGLLQPHQGQPSIADHPPPPRSTIDFDPMMISMTSQTSSSESAGSYPTTAQYFGDEAEYRFRLQEEEKLKLELAANQSDPEGGHFSNPFAKSDEDFGKELKNRYLDQRSIIGGDQRGLIASDHPDQPNYRSIGNDQGARIDRSVQYDQGYRFAQSIMFDQPSPTDRSVTDHLPIITKSADHRSIITDPTDQQSIDHPADQQPQLGGNLIALVQNHLQIFKPATDQPYESIQVRNTFIAEPTAGIDRSNQMISDPLPMKIDITSSLPRHPALRAVDQMPSLVEQSSNESDSDRSTKGHQRRLIRGSNRYPLNNRSMDNESYDEEVVLNVTLVAAEVDFFCDCTLRETIVPMLTAEASARGDQAAKSISIGKEFLWTLTTSRQSSEIGTPSSSRRESKGSIDQQQPQGDRSDRSIEQSDRSIPIDYRSHLIDRSNLAKFKADKDSEFDRLHEKGEKVKSDLEQAIRELESEITDYRFDQSIDEKMKSQEIKPPKETPVDQQVLHNRLEQLKKDELVPQSTGTSIETMDTVGTSGSSMNGQKQKRTLAETVRATQELRTQLSDIVSTYDREVTYLLLSVENYRQQWKKEHTETQRQLNELRKNVQKLEDKSPLDQPPQPPTSSKIPSRPSTDHSQKPKSSSDHKHQSKKQPEKPKLKHYNPDLELPVGKEKLSELNRQLFELHMKLSSGNGNGGDSSATLQTGGSGEKENVKSMVTNILKQLLDIRADPEDKEAFLQSIPPTVGAAAYGGDQTRSPPQLPQSPRDRIFSEEDSSTTTIPTNFSIDQMSPTAARSPPLIENNRDSRQFESSQNSVISLKLKDEPIIDRSIDRTYRSIDRSSVRSNRSSVRSNRSGPGDKESIALSINLPDEDEHASIVAYIVPMRDQAPPPITPIANQQQQPSPLMRRSKSSDDLSIKQAIMQKAAEAERLENGGGIEEGEDDGALMERKLLSERSVISVQCEKKRRSKSFEASFKDRLNSRVSDDFSIHEWSPPDLPRYVSDGGGANSGSGDLMASDTIPESKQMKGSPEIKVQLASKQLASQEPPKDKLNWSKSPIYDSSIDSGIGLHTIDRDTDSSGARIASARATDLTAKPIPIQDPTDLQLQQQSILIPQQQNTSELRTCHIHLHRYSMDGPAEFCRRSRPAEKKSNSKFPSTVSCSTQTIGEGAKFKLTNEGGKKSSILAALSAAALNGQGGRKEEKLIQRRSESEDSKMAGKSKKTPKDQSMERIRPKKESPPIESIKLEPAEQPPIEQPMEPEPPQTKPAPKARPERYIDDPPLETVVHPLKGSRASLGASPPRPNPIGATSSASRASLGSSRSPTRGGLSSRPSSTSLSANKKRPSSPGPTKLKKPIEMTEVGDAVLAMGVQLVAVVMAPSKPWTNVARSMLDTSFTDKFKRVVSYHKKLQARSRSNSAAASMDPPLDPAQPRDIGLPPKYGGRRTVSERQMPRPSTQELQRIEEDRMGPSTEAEIGLLDPNLRTRKKLGGGGNRSVAGRNGDDGETTVIENFASGRMMMTADEHATHRTKSEADVFSTKKKGSLKWKDNTWAYAE